MSKAPFRAEIIGSLLRPQKLLDARARLEGDQYATVKGSRSFGELHAIEDAAIRDAVALQEGVGLEVVTDGEFRRRSWYQDFVLALGGTKIAFVDASQTISAALPFQDETGSEKLPGHLVQVDGKLRRDGAIFGDAFKFLKAATKVTPKVSIPSPTMLHFWGGRQVIDRGAYPDLDAFWSDLVDIYLGEIRDLHALGCRYLQIDDVTFPIICDPRGAQAMKERGDEPAALIRTYAEVLNRIVAGAPKDMRIGMHMCRGNNRGKWMAEGGYEFVSETVFKSINIDTYFMEYDSDRAGDFRPLRHVPEGKYVVLGLISTKTPKLEDADGLKRRIEEAGKFMPHDHLCLSPQCGFASTKEGNRLTEDEQKRKLEHLVALATDIWGGV
jgi:5-methyltetrahydropteroyltriglutamate--homocysteine methyltransferase